MSVKNRGGYDDGYEAVPCLWGTQPGSLVQRLLKNLKTDVPLTVLDLGCGEGKNAAVFARLGFSVDAIDCSHAAIENGRRAFSDEPINWMHGDVASLEFGVERYDIVICYGVLHCLSDADAVASVTERVQLATRRGGANVVCAFNDRSHDMSAHPGFDPTLLPHTWFVSRYSHWQCDHSSDTDLHEIHPHNGIPHHHSLTRILARKPK